MIGQPPHERSGVAAGQHVNDLVRLTIGDHRAVGLPALGGEIIDPQDARGVIERIGHRPDPVQ
jgi:hypothetical protein